MIIFKSISYRDAIKFLLPRHYSGRKPVISFAYGYYVDSVLKAVVTYGKPASPPLCVGIMNGKYRESVYELNRLCREDDLHYPLSEFVAWSLRELAEIGNFIIVSFADTAMSHNGIIYQATNFIYTGCTKRRTDKYTDGNKHSRHYDNDNQHGLRKVRSAKHRYVYFCTKNKKLRKQWRNDLAYKIEPYPTGSSKRYMLGTFLQPEIIKQ